MKRFLIIIGVLLSVAAAAQPPLQDFTPRRFSQIQVNRLGLSNDTLPLPENLKDSVWLKAKDSVLFLWSPSLRRYVRVGGGGTGSAVWGGLAGSINSQTDLINKFALYQPIIAQGPTTQYLRADLSKSNFATDVASAGSGIFAPSSHLHRAAEISDLTTFVGNMFTGGTGISYNPITRTISATYVGAGGHNYVAQKSIVLNDSTFSLFNDDPTPGPNNVYGTGLDGVKVWRPDIVGLYYSAKYLGITGTGDKTSAFNTLYSGSNKTIVLDENQNYTISGTLNGQGKFLKVENGAMLTGTGTVSNIYVIAPPDQQIFASTLNVSGLLNTRLELGWFGLKSDNATDNRPLFKKALNASPKLTSLHFPTNLDNDDAHSGPYYIFNDSITIDRKVEIYGDGKNKSVIVFPNSAGFYIRNSAAGTYIHDFKIKGYTIGEYSGAYNDNIRHGIIDSAIGRIEYMKIGQFPGDGIRVYGSSPSSNASLTVIKGNDLEFNGRDGLSIKGGDANELLVEGNNFRLNGKWGSADSSFLGVYYAGNHYATNAGPEAGGYSVVVRNDSVFYALANSGPANGGAIIPGTTSGWRNYWQYKSNCTTCSSITWSSSTNYFLGGAWVSSDPNHQGVRVGDYEEHDGPDAVNVNNLILGGFAAKYGQVPGSIGVRQGVVTARNFQAWNEDITAGAFMRGKVDNYDDGFIGIKDEANNIFSGFVYNQAGKYVSIAAGNQTYNPAHIFSGYQNGSNIGRAAIPVNGAMAFNGIWDQQQSGGYRFIGLGTAPPTSGEYATGDCVIDNSGSANTSYVCVSGGSPGAWITKGGSIYATINKSGDGTTTTFSYAHGLSTVGSDSHVFVQARSAAAAGTFYVTIDATNVNIVYTTAPASGSNNLKFSIQIIPVAP